MDEIITFGPKGALHVYGVKLVGMNAENAVKLLVTLVLIVLVVGLSRLVRLLLLGFNRRYPRTTFWVRQGVQVGAALILLVGVVSIWFDDPTRLATGIGLVTAGLAFALQRVVTAVAGYVLILRGQTFNVGDRILMGGVRGDVVALGFLQTTIMEMGQPPAVQDSPPSMWVRSRQYTGRVVTVSNARIFEEPIYNYTRDFPYLWEEMTIPIAYRDDRRRAEEVLLQAARTHSVDVATLAEDELRELERRYLVHRSSLEPRVYLQLTDNWAELTVRFVTREFGIREAKDAISREILDGLERARIPIASATFEIVGLPDVRLRRANPHGRHDVGDANTSS